MATMNPDSIMNLIMTPSRPSNFNHSGSTRKSKREKSPRLIHSPASSPELIGGHDDSINNNQTGISDRGKLANGKSCSLESSSQYSSSSQYRGNSSNNNSLFPSSGDSTSITTNSDNTVSVHSPNKASTLPSSNPPSARKIKKKNSFRKKISQTLLAVTGASSSSSSSNVVPQQNQPHSSLSGQVSASGSGGGATISKVKKSPSGCIAAIMMSNGGTGKSTDEDDYCDSHSERIGACDGGRTGACGSTYYNSRYQPQMDDSDEDISCYEFALADDRCVTYNNR